MITRDSAADAVMMKEKKHPRVAARSASSRTYGTRALGWPVAGDTPSYPTPGQAGARDEGKGASGLCGKPGAVPLFLQRLGPHCGLEGAEPLRGNFTPPQQPVAGWLAVLVELGFSPNVSTQGHCCLQWMDIR